MASIRKQPNGRWQARYYDSTGKQHARRFDRKVDGQRWIDEQTAALVAGTHVDPRTARQTVDQWCDTWLEGYASRAPSTLRQAKVHLRLIRQEFGTMQLSSVRPSSVKAWTARLTAEGYEPSYVYAVYRRLAQVMGDAVADGIIPRSPCSRKTAPKTGEQRPYVATTEQIWALYEAFPEGLRPAVLLGAFAGLRLAEAAALRVTDMDFMRGIVHPAIQYPDKPLKSDTSRTAVPIPAELALMLSAEVARTGADVLVTDAIMRPATPWAIERAMREVRGSIKALPEGFRFHDCRHYFASLLISAGLDVKVVQTRLRHASAMTTLNTYGHMWPDKDESSRAAVAVALAAREDKSRTKEVST
ncbi:tyrosine-type recombinase/integrase [Humibacillus xanthopallidus]|uniref:Site-specific recombinase XerD n=1 Tax=Humibacillus xanthopallidus TaxID=412689 RepID=A0A543HXI0_9MICO|nr:site-specific integrase [Humibacillus xanthopallidus]TQM62945.1 site-specific recombinase XerD [Humibacillus xanthopallidus]